MPNVTMTPGKPLFDDKEKQKQMQADYTAAYGFIQQYIKDKGKISKGGQIDSKTTKAVMAIANIVANENPEFVEVLSDKTNLIYNENSKIPFSINGNDTLDSLFKFMALNTSFKAFMPQFDNGIYASNPKNVNDKEITEKRVADVIKTLNNITQKFSNDSRVNTSIALASSFQFAIESLAGFETQFSSNSKARETINNLTKTLENGITAAYESIKNDPKSVVALKDANTRLKLTTQINNTNNKNTKAKPNFIDTILQATKNDITTNKQIDTKLNGIFAQIATQNNITTQAALAEINKLKTDIDTVTFVNNYLSKILTKANLEKFVGEKSKEVNATLFIISSAYLQELQDISINVSTDEDAQKKYIDAQAVVFGCMRKCYENINKVNYNKTLNESAAEAETNKQLTAASKTIVNGKQSEIISEPQLKENQALLRHAQTLEKEKLSAKEGLSEDELNRVSAYKAEYRPLMEALNREGLIGSVADFRLLSGEIYTDRAKKVKEIKNTRLFNIVNNGVTLKTDDTAITELKNLDIKKIASAINALNNAPNKNKILYPTLKTTLYYALLSKASTPDYNVTPEGFNEAKALITNENDENAKDALKQFPTAKTIGKYVNGSAKQIITGFKNNTELYTGDKSSAAILFGELKDKIDGISGLDYLNTITESGKFATGFKHPIITANSGKNVATKQQKVGAGVAFGTAAILAATAAGIGIGAVINNNKPIVDTYDARNAIVNVYEAETDALKLFEQKTGFSLNFDGLDFNDNKVELEADAFNVNDGLYNRTFVFTKGITAEDATANSLKTNYEKLNKTLTENNDATVLNAEESFKDTTKAFVESFDKFITENADELIKNKKIVYKYNANADLETKTKDCYTNKKADIENGLAGIKLPDAAVSTIELQIDDKAIIDGESAYKVTAKIISQDAPYMGTKIEFLAKGLNEKEALANITFENIQTAKMFVSHDFVADFAKKGLEKTNYLDSTITVEPEIPEEPTEPEQPTPPENPSDAVNGSPSGGNIGGNDKTPGTNPDGGLGGLGKMSTGKATKNLML